MALTVEELLVKIDADLQGLRAELQAGKTAVDKASKSMKASLDKVGDAVIRNVAKFGKWAAATIAASTAAGVAMAKVGADMAASLGDVSERLGITSQKLLALRAAAGEAGTGTEQLDNSIRDFNKNLGAAVQGATEMRVQFSRLGLSVEELQKLSPDEAMLRTSEALAKVGSKAEQTRIAMALFGEGGIKLINTFGQLRESTRDQEERMRRLGIATSALDIEKARTGSAAWARQMELMNGFMRQLGAELGPVFAVLQEKLSKAIEGAGGVGIVISKVRDIVFKAVEFIGDAWQGLNVMWSGSKVIILAVGEAFFETVKYILQGADWLYQKLDAFWDWLKASAEVAWQLLKTGFSSVVSLVGRGFGELARMAGKTFKTIGEQVASTGIEGVADLGRDLQEAGANLEISGFQIAQGSKTLLQESKNALELQVAELTDARERLLAAPQEASTPAVDLTLSTIRTQLEAAKTELGNHVNDITQNGTLGAAWAAELQALVDNLDQQLAARVAHNEAVAEAQRAADEQKIAQQSAYDSMIGSLRASLLDEERKDIEANQRLWEAGMRGRLQLVSGTLSTLSTLMQSENKKMFEVGKAAAIADAVVQTYLGATRALATVPYPLNFAAAAAVAAAGFVNVRKIQSQKLGGGSGGGGSGGGGAPAVSGGGQQSNAQPAQITRTTNVNVSLVGNSFNQNQIRGMIDQFSEAVGDGVRFKVST